MSKKGKPAKKVRRGADALCGTGISKRPATIFFALVLLSVCVYLFVFFEGGGTLCAAETAAASGESGKPTEIHGRDQGNQDAVQIIMGERPISIGDLIELDGVVGKVEEIGARCTKVRTGENIHILVPNSGFLEKNITNWTLSDQKIRAHVSVGVVYGSPVEEVNALLIRAVSENPSVLKPPDPFVLFNDFGDNALIFAVHFWISIRRIIERRLIESTVRFRIDELFREAGIVIAFPQRDVHLDTQRPLEVTITNAGGDAKLPPGADG